MNHRLTLAQVIQGYMLAAEARHLSPHTIKDYTNMHRKFVHFIGADTPFDQITRQDIESFLAGFSGVTNKTLLIYYTALAAIWTWAA